MARHGEDCVPKSPAVCAKWTTLNTGFAAPFRGREKLKGDDNGEVFDV